MRAAVAKNKKESCCTITTPPAASWFPFNASNSITNKPLPADVLQHCYGNTADCSQGDALAKYALTNDGAATNFGRRGDTVGFIQFGMQASQNSAEPIYYGQATDPWYKLSHCLYEPNINVTFHAPNRARASAAPGNDQNILIYDVAQNLLVGLYGFSSSSAGGAYFPDASSCPGSGPSSCAVPVQNANGCSATRVGVDSDRPSPSIFNATVQGNTYTLGGLSAGNGLVAGAGVIREKELMSGAINHAIWVGTYCAHPSNYVFPANAVLGKCSNDPANAPPAGALFFTDYTPAQIASLLAQGQISQPQATLLTTMSTYGGYLLITGGPTWAGMNLGNEMVESGAAYQYYNVPDPIVAWGCSQGMNDVGESTCSNGTVSGNFDPSLNVLGGLPLLTGPGGTDRSGRSCRVAPGCDVSGHIHTADPCLVKRLAGVAGAC